MFRPEVALAKQQAGLGEIQLQAPRSSRAVLGVALVVMGVTSTLLWLGEYTSRQHVAGEIVPAQGIIKVATPLAGTVTKVGVHEGQDVQAGDALFEISGEQQSTRLGATQGQVIEQIQAERARLSEQLIPLAAIAEREASNGREKRVNLHAQRDAIQGQIEIARKEAESGERMLSRVRPLLEKGYLSAVQVQQQEASVLQVRSRLNELQRQHLDAEMRVDQADTDAQSMPAHAAEKRDAILRQINTLDQQRVQAEALRGQTVRASVSGRVAAVPAHLGQAVVSGEVLLTLVPQGSSLQAELRVPSSAVGFVNPGDRVALRYQAYPYQHYGLQWGTVRQISETTAHLTADASRSDGGQSPAGYRVAVELDHDTIRANGEDKPLKPGMAIDADLFQERRRLIDWVIEPAASFMKNTQGNRL